MTTETQQKETPDYTIAADELKTFFDSLNIQATTSEPSPFYNENSLPMLNYTVSFRIEGKNPIRFDYKLGIGYVKPKRLNMPYSLRLNANEESLLHAWASNPHANFKDKELWANVAVKLAKIQKVTPKPEQVMAAICSEAFEARNSKFEDWAIEFGYDSDSRKAEQIYTLCEAEYWIVKTLLNDKQIQRFAELNARL